MLIDGYNLLRAVQNCSDEFSAIDDVLLCAVISEYLRRTKKKGVIVFDGIGPPDKTALHSIGNPKVIFSGRRFEADDIIEDMIGEHSAPKRLVVVSTDRRIKVAAKKRKAKAINSLDFWAEVVKCIEKKRKHAPEPREKLSGITPAETEHWLREFGLKK
ncbi:MAG: NYN domain-containing protein [Anaerohalosphaeraceae bacterium]|nr:NYN domain-containing protein [Anaerohalosphaeraceae bacterium]